MSSTATATMAEQADVDVQSVTPVATTTQVETPTTPTNTSTASPTRRTTTLASPHNTSHTTTTPKSTSTSTASSNAVRISTLRLTSDMKALEAESVDGIDASPLDTDNLYIWRACIFGPVDTCWEGAVLQLQLCFPTDYPQKPPTVRFTSAIYHPNVFSDGNLCLDLLQDNWSPIHSVSTILTSIQSLLTDPNVNSPANPEAAKLYTVSKKEYNKKVRSMISKSK